VSARVQLVLVFALLALPGCAGPTQQVVRFAEASRDLATVAEPCLAGIAAAEAQACANDATCQEATKAKWKPVADLYDYINATWCALAPEAEGCAK
jgi:hypothetical protein